MDEYGDVSTAEYDGGQGSAILGSIFSDVASVTNTAIIANANPVNAAILTNTPISSSASGISTGVSGFSMSNPGSAWIWIAVAIAVIFLYLRSE